MYFDSSEARKRTVAATSSGSVDSTGGRLTNIPPSRSFVAIAAPISAVMLPLPIGVLTPVGCTLLTRMPCLPSSAANALAMPRTANLLVV
jgi:hypothetical protein